MRVHQEAAGAPLPRAGALGQPGAQAMPGKSRPRGCSWAWWASGRPWGSGALGTLIATGSRSLLLTDRAGSGSKKNKDKCRFSWCLQVIIRITATGWDVLKFPRQAVSSEPGHCGGCLAILLCVRGPLLWEARVKWERETGERRCARSLWAGRTLSRGPRTGHGAETWATQGKVRGPHSSSCRWEPGQAAQCGASWL